MLHRHADLLKFFQEGVAVNFVLGFATLIGWGILFRAQQGGPLEFSGAAWPVYFIAGSAHSWFFSFALMGLFLGKFDAESKPVRYLADASYWMYLAHLPLVIVLQEWLVPMTLNPWQKFLAINAMAFAVLLASYQWFVRYTIIGAVLNGPRKKGLSRAGAPAG